MNTSRVSIQGDRTPPGLAATVDEWSRRIADVLGVDGLSEATVVFHNTPGVPRVNGTTVHLFCGPRGEPAIAYLPHELVHLVVGSSPRRFLTEGLAVSVDARLRLGPPAWPCYRLSPEGWAVELRRRGHFPRLSEVAEQAEGLSLVAAGPDQLKRAWQVYVLAGAFTEWALETMGQKFWAFYREGIDERTLDELSEQWLEHLPSELDAEERALLRASLEDARAELRSTGATPVGAPGGGGVPA